MVNNELDIFSQKTSRPFRVAEERLSPRSYRGGMFGYFITCYIPFLWTLGFAFYVCYTRQIVAWPTVGLLASITALTVAVLFVSGLRLEITSQGIQYFARFKGGTFLNFNDISSVILIDHRLGAWRPFLQYTLLIAPTVSINKPDLKIPLTFFESDARTDLVNLLQPTSVRDRFRSSP